jgi:iron(III) transport system permease protein
VWFSWVEAAAVIVLILQIAVPLFSLVAVVGDLEKLRSAVSAATGAISFTFLISGFAAILSVPITYAVAKQLANAARWTWLYWTLVLAPLTLPPPLIGIGLIAVWNWPSAISVYGSVLMPVLAVIARFAPVAVLVGYAQLRRVDPSLLEAGKIFQPNRLKYAVWIKVPLVTPGLVAAGLSMLALSAGELGATLMVIPPGRQTLSIRVYNFMHYGSSTTVASLCLIMVMITLAGGALSLLCVTGWRRGFFGDNHDSGQ